MTTNSLYHTHGIRRYKYQKTHQTNEKTPPERRGFCDEPQIEPDWRNPHSCHLIFSWIF